MQKRLYIWGIIIPVVALFIVTGYVGCGGGGGGSSSSGSSSPFPGYTGNLNQTNGVIYNGGNMDWGSDIAVDNTIAGSPVIYTLGAAFTSPTGDGSSILAKFDSNGAITATARLNCMGGMAMALNPQFGVYITGQGSSAYETAKFDLNLNLITTTSLAGDASARGIALDNSGNVYVIGSEHHTPSFGNEFDYKIVKYDVDLVQQGLPITYDSGATDEGSGIAVDNSGNIYVTGAKISGTDYSFVTLKYDSSLTLLNTAVYSTNVYIDSNHGLYPKIAVNSGSVYVVGTVLGVSTDRDILLIKYDSALNQVNAVTYPDGLEGVNLALDASGNVYVFGNYYNGSVPDAWLVVKYNSALAFQSYLTDKFGTNTMDEPGGIALDTAGNIYLNGITAPTFNSSDWSNWNMRAKRFAPLLP